MSVLREEIETRFSLQSDYAAYQLQRVGADYPAWAIRLSDGEYGVIVEYSGSEISENFAGAYLESRKLRLKDDAEKQYLMLSCRNNMLRKQFAALCEDFVEPGNNGENRTVVTEEPLRWWKEWRELLGNRQSEDRIYDLIAELSALLKLCREGKSDAYWTASRINTHDIEMEDSSYEVKASVKKEITTIHVSSQFQLKSEKPLYLIFTRLEESETGESVDDLLTELSHYQYSQVVEYNNYLEEKGLKAGNHGRKRKFAVLERRKYTIDDSFPVISDEMFIEGRLPDGITHLEYDIVLDGMSYENWK